MRMTQWMYINASKGSCFATCVWFQNWGKCLLDDSTAHDPFTMWPWMQQTMKTMDTLSTIFGFSLVGKSLDPTGFQLWRWSSCRAEDRHVYFQKCYPFLLPRYNRCILYNAILKGSGMLVWPFIHVFTRTRPLALKAGQCWHLLQLDSEISPLVKQARSGVSTKLCVDLSGQKIRQIEFKVGNVLDKTAICQEQLRLWGQG